MGNLQRWYAQKFSDIDNFMDKINNECMGISINKLEIKTYLEQTTNWRKCNVEVISGIMANIPDITFVTIEITTPEGIKKSFEYDRDLTSKRMR